ncbi:carboxy terminal-processing peptidase [Flavobacterium azooxidireducens]|uniref:Carboxy terminal-processing peptidase n=1 Tax=Flavobacterium azooxidireducens TaxID=1871076 RepID=A0ABY4KBX9_9FLAO|nr:carboxy terminal-processing peptidase [Flavobacterium azooxidireducens]UPQ77805.1 carboxy terminal-processing peptidase [Flavobacterium azooxidireducens]
MKTILLFMKRNLKLVLLTVVLSVALLAFNAIDSKKSVSSDPEKDKLLIDLLTFVIERGHYDPAAIDDNLSKGIYKDYIEALDPSKRFFLQSDIDEFSKYETLIDDQIKNKDLSFFDLTYNLYLKRMQESQKYYKEILEKPFDYTVDETINTDYEKLPYAKNTDELKERWRKQIKLSTLSSLTDRIKLQEDEKNGIIDEKINNVKDEKLKEKLKAEKDKKKEEKPKSIEELEKETRESSLKSLDDYFTFIKELDRNDWFGVYVNAIASRFDPHTNYMAPDDKERFDVSISGKFEGIGARLQKKNDLTEITELISGGPAWRGKELEQGDVILKVAQGDGEPVDVIGMRLDNVVKKIKGPKGTEVRLTVKKVDGTMKVISLIRDMVETEETYAKSSVVERNGMKYGIIYLPKFYIDFENQDSRDAGKDVAIEVERLKAQGVNGIIMDVRDNGGGSLKTAVDITGLFIEQGPVVQIKSAGTKKEVLYDKDPKIQWDGPLVVMVNNFSASASEILAAAIQDYKRGVVIGSKQTYGKGTVQNVIDLNQFVRGNNVGDLGALKTTTQKFYRINGGSTQLEGVTSDVEMPDRYSYIDIGERDLDNAMPWTKIDPAPFNIWDKQTNFDRAVQNSKARMAQDEHFQLIEKSARWTKERRDAAVYSLKLDAFTAEQNSLEEKSKQFKPISDYKNDLVFKPVPQDFELMSKDESFKEKRERWFESLSKDIYVEEALNVLDDLQSKPVVKGKVDLKKKIVKS